MIIDCHTHIFPDHIKNSRQDYFQNESQFSLLYKDPKSKIFTAKELIESMDKCRVDKSIVFGFPWNTFETAKKNNDYIINECLKYKTRLIPFACFNPLQNYAGKEAQRCADNGFTGFGELGFYDLDFTSKVIEALNPIMELACKKNMPVMIHTNEPIGHNYPGKAPCTIKNIAKLIESCPNNKLILAHLGGGIPFFETLKKNISLKNVVFDTAAVPFIYKKNIYAILEAMNLQDKIVFGTDWPLISPARYIKDIEENNLSLQFKENLFYKNILPFIE